MRHLFSRRSFVLGAASLLALAHRADAAQRNWYIGRIPDQPFDIPLVDKSLIPVRFHRQSVPYTGREAAGTILINKRERFLYYIEGGGRAVRYGIAVGRDGQRWTGEAVVGRMARWPSWTPTANMRRRNPNLPQRVAGGPQNPLGARAIYLYRDGRDTLFRIHGTNEPWSIGNAASSGCIRMLNEHVLELFGTVRNGARVIVL
ncbi:L,D-transpeptidase [Shinella zoogloeoides]|uniref:L,D-transpeptidase family protein n=1 Tax=Shinella zoogloeoides TaxID=352475 RepID=A0A6N8TD35_SHIZO|nr:L,D-transpeptidase [Shinella zoogloeoides]MXO01177.1 L,D-transpeptidase family protein [Shinella zoogloeoides]UEX84290.1 L,D-transpeptidase [Shinella zoogloeoides]